MGLFKIDLKDSSEHDLRKIDRQYIPRIFSAIESLAENPFPIQSNGKFDFGPWEQIFYCEFDRRRKKMVPMKVIGE